MKKHEPAHRAPINDTLSDHYIPHEAITNTCNDRIRHDCAHGRNLLPSNRG